MGSRSVGQFAESTVVNWQRNHVDQRGRHHDMRPRYISSSQWRAKEETRAFLSHIELSQVYTDRSRRDYQQSYKRVLLAIRDSRVVQVRWKCSKEVPSFSPDFLFLYLNRFGKVEAVHQMATNSCLVAFANHQTLRVVLHTPNLGLPYARLYIRRWTPANQDHDYHRVVAQLEHCTATRRRVAAIAQHDPRDKDQVAAYGKAMASVYREEGPCLRRCLRSKLKDWKVPTERCAPPDNKLLL